MWNPATPRTGSAPEPSALPKSLEKSDNISTTATPLPEIAPTPPQRSAVLNSQEQGIIGKSLVIKGEVTGSESLYIDGKVEGSIALPGNRLTIGRNGEVSANITAREVVILGRLRGNIAASDRVDIRNEGSLTGDVVAQRISIEDGAFFKGGIDIRKPGQKTNGESKEGAQTSHSTR